MHLLPFVQTLPYDKPVRGLLEQTTAVTLALRGQDAGRPVEYEGYFSSDTGNELSSKLEEMRRALMQTQQELQAPKDRNRLLQLENETMTDKWKRGILNRAAHGSRDLVS